MERIDKILSDSGIGSRKEIKKYIASGRITVNGQLCRDGAQKADRDSSLICFDASAVNTRRFRYFVLNKPAGVITATEDKHAHTVLDLISDCDRRLNLFPVGRLDKDTTGMLLLTNDGDFAHRVISPACHVNKRYLAQTEKTPDDVARLSFARGLVLADGTQCQNALLETVGECLCTVTIHEGKYHQVKRMLAAVGCPVLKLHRLSIGALSLPEELGAGDYRELSDEELEKIFI